MMKPPKGAPATGATFSVYDSPPTYAVVMAPPCVSVKPHGGGAVPNVSTVWPSPGASMHPSV